MVPFEDSSWLFETFRAAGGDITDVSTVGASLQFDGAAGRFWVKGGNDLRGKYTITPDRIMVSESVRHLVLFSGLVGLVDNAIEGVMGSGPTWGRQGNTLTLSAPSGDVLTLRRMTEADPRSAG